LIDLVGELIAFYKYNNPTVELPSDPKAAIRAMCMKSDPQNFDKLKDTFDESITPLEEKKTEIQREIDELTDESKMRKIKSKNKF